MKILKNLSKPIILFISIISLALFISAVTLCYSKQLFVGEKYAVATFSEVIGKSVKYSLVGLIHFSDNLVAVSSKGTILQNSLFKDQEVTNALISSAKTLKVLAIVIMVVIGLYFLSYLFSFRIEATTLLSLVTLILFVVLINTTHSNFASSKLIVDVTKYGKAIVTLLSISAGFNAIACFVKYVVKYSKA